MKAAKEGIAYTEEQLRVLEQARRERETVQDEIETHHPGYLLAQDTFYVGYLKGVGRIYQQTVIGTYSSVAFAKLYTAKVPSNLPPWDPRPEREQIGSQEQPWGAVKNYLPQMESSS